MFRRDILFQYCFKIGGSGGFGLWICDEFHLEDKITSKNWYESSIRSVHEHFSIFLDPVYVCSSLVSSLFGDYLIIITSYDPCPGFLISNSI